MSRTRKIKASWMKYKYIVAWGRYVDSKDYYIDDQVEQAIREVAPENAIARRSDGHWRTLEELDDALKQTLIEYANKMTL